MLGTNVIVSALLDTGSIPGQVLDLFVDEACTWLVDRRIVLEYQDVLPRPKFRFEAARVERIVTGNTKHFQLQTGHLDLRIVTPRQFLDLLAGR